MLRSVPAAVILLVLLMLSLAGDARPPVARPDLDGAAVEGEILLGLRPAALALGDAMLEERLGIQVLARLPEIGGVRARLQPGESVAEGVRRLVRLPWVDFAEPNHLLRSAATPNDPHFTGQSAYLALIQAPAAWDIEPGRDSVLVAVLDTGIDVDHEDLAGKVWTNPLEMAGNGIDDDRNGCVDDVHGCGFVTPGGADAACAATAPHSISDDNGHGTFVAGIIAARGNNGIGVTGAAPGVTILPVKILDCEGSGSAAEAAQGILYAARAGARVANISFRADGQSLTLASAIRQAHDQYGMVIVAATGNEGRGTVSFPARLPQVIAVGSSGTPSDPSARSAFSDWGPEVAVVAPGMNIISTVPLEYCGISWLCVQADQPYALASGTSFAAPLASALAALLVSRNPNISPTAVRAIMRATAEPLPDGGTPNWDGAGRIRMRAALEVPRFTVGVAGVSRQ